MSSTPRKLSEEKRRFMCRPVEWETSHPEPVFFFFFVDRRSETAVGHLPPFIIDHCRLSLLTHIKDFARNCCIGKAMIHMHSAERKDTAEHNMHRMLRFDDPSLRFLFFISSLYSKASSLAKILCLSPFTPGHSLIVFIIFFILLLMCVINFPVFDIFLPVP